MLSRASYAIPGCVSIAVGGYYSIPFHQRQQLDCSALGAKRAFRSVACFSELAIRYKLLAWRYGQSPDFVSHRAEVHRYCAGRVLELCRSNGGLFTKFGQHAATLRPAVPDEYVEALAVLQDNAPSRPFHKVADVIRVELNLEASHDLVGPGSPFLEFESVPLGSASLAQVHRARLNDGREVAVKVQHYDIETVAASDVCVIRWLDHLASCLFEDFCMAWAVDEFEVNVKRELDFREEASNGSFCRELFKRNVNLSTRLFVPEVISNLSTGKVLTMEFARGIPIRNIVQAVEKKHRIEQQRRQRASQGDVPFDSSSASVPLSGAGLESMSEDEEWAATWAPEVARCLVETYAAMFFTYGFVHCDPHPGNFLVVLPERQMSKRGLHVNKSPTLVLLDHGLYRKLPEHFRLANCGLWKAMVLQDARGVVQHCVELGIEENEASWLPIYFMNRLPETKAGLGQPVSAEEKDVLKARLVSAGLCKKNGADVLSILEACAARVPADMLFVMRTMHLVASLHKALGCSPAERFKIYAWGAAVGEFELPIRGPGEVGAFTLIAIPRWLLQRAAGCWLFLRLWLHEKRMSYGVSSSAIAQEHFSLASAMAEAQRGTELGS